MNNLNLNQQTNHFCNYQSDNNLQQNNSLNEFQNEKKLIKKNANQNQKFQYSKKISKSQIFCQKNHSKHQNKQKNNRQNLRNNITQNSKNKIILEEQSIQKKYEDYNLKFFIFENTKQKLNAFCIYHYNKISKFYLKNKKIIRDDNAIGLCSSCAVKFAKQQYNIEELNFDVLKQQIDFDTRQILDQWKNQVQSCSNLLSYINQQQKNFQQIEKTIHQNIGQHINSIQQIINECNQELFSQLDKQLKQEKKQFKEEQQKITLFIQEINQTIQDIEKYHYNIIGDGKSSNKICSYYQEKIFNLNNLQRSFKVPQNFDCINKYSYLKVKTLQRFRTLYKQFLQQILNENEQENNLSFTSKSFELFSMPQKNVIQISQTQSDKKSEISQFQNQSYQLRIFEKNQDVNNQDASNDKESLLKTPIYKKQKQNYFEKQQVSDQQSNSYNFDDFELSDEKINQQQKSRLINQKTLSQIIEEVNISNPKSSSKYTGSTSKIKKFCRQDTLIIGYRNNKYKSLNNTRNLSKQI